MFCSFVFVCLFLFSFFGFLGFFFFCCSVVKKIQGTLDACRRQTMVTIIIFMTTLDVLHKIVVDSIIIVPWMMTLR